MSKKQKYTRLPYKELTNGSLASGVFLASYFLGGYTLGISALLGASCYVGYRMLFGTDLSRSELWKDVDKAMAQRAIRTITEARTLMRDIKEINDAIPCPDLSEKLEKIEDLGKEIVALLEKNPADVNRSKRFVEVYLTGAVSVSRKFADINQHVNEKEVYQQYHDFLDETIRVFDKQRAALLDDDMLDLDVEIEVLKKRMRMEAYNRSN